MENFNLLGKVVSRIVGLSSEKLKTINILLGRMLGASGDKWFTDLKRFLDEGGFLPGENHRPSRSWYEEGDVIYFSVTRSELSGQEQIESLRGKNFRFITEIINILLSLPFKKQHGEPNEIRIAIVKGKMFTDDNRTTENVRIEAERRNFKKLNPEMVCLIRDKLTDQDIEEMGFRWIVIMHDPVDGLKGYPVLLRTGADDGGGHIGASREDGRVTKFSINYGFAFDASQADDQ